MVVVIILSSIVFYILANESFFFKNLSILWNYHHIYLIRFVLISNASRDRYLHKRIRGQVSNGLFGFPSHSLTLPNSFIHSFHSITPSIRIHIFISARCSWRKKFAQLDYLLMCHTVKCSEPSFIYRKKSWRPEYDVRVCLIKARFPNVSINDEAFLQLPTKKLIDKNHFPECPCVYNNTYIFSHISPYSVQFISAPPSHKIYIFEIYSFFLSTCE